MSENKIPSMGEMLKEQSKMLYEIMHISFRVREHLESVPGDTPNIAEPCCMRENLVVNHNMMRDIIATMNAIAESVGAEL